jgi:hypothetical protein
MSLQTGIAVDVIHAAEASFAALASSGIGKRIRRTTSTLALSKATNQSSELRPDYQVVDLRHGLRKVKGDIRTELSLVAHDDWLEAVLRGGWSSGATMAAGATITALGHTFTRSGGSWLADGFRIGDVARWSGLSAGNDGRRLRITDLTASVMTVAETVETVASPVSAASCSVAGRKLTNGVQQHSFTIEHVFADAGFSQLFSGCRIGKLDLTLPASGFVTATFGVTGRDMTVREGAEAPYFTAPAAFATHPALATVDGTLRLGASDIGVVTGLNLSIDLGLSGDGVLGTDVLPEIFYGRTSVTGTLTAFVEDASLLKSFDGEEELALHVLLAAPGAAAGGFLALHLPRIKFTGGSIRVEGEHGLPITLPFQALGRVDGDARYDAATIVLQQAEV